MKRTKVEQKQAITEPVFICSMCEDTGEIPKFEPNIIDGNKGQKGLHYTGFCKCKIGRQKAKIFNNGLNNG